MRSQEPPAIVSEPQQKTILVVEDDDDVRESLVDVLRETGRSVVEANDGLQALERLEQLPRPCLILLDLMMPRMDGHEFISRLRERHGPHEFPVLVISAHDSIGAAQGYPGVLGTLPKPFDVRRLLSFVEAYC